jgi:hypothetical protein
MPGCAMGRASQLASAGWLTFRVSLCRAAAAHRAACDMPQRVHIHNRGSAGLHVCAIAARVSRFGNILAAAKGVAVPAAGIGCPHLPEQQQQPAVPVQVHAATKANAVATAP